MISFRTSVKDQDVKEVIPKPGQFMTYTIGQKNKLHGFFENADSRDNNYLLMIIESSTHIIDFAKMSFVGTGDTVSNIEFQ